MYLLEWEKKNVVVASTKIMPFNDAYTHYFQSVWLDGKRKGDCHFSKFSPMFTTSSQLIEESFEFLPENVKHFLHIGSLHIFPFHTTTSYVDLYVARIRRK